MQFKPVLYYYYYFTAVGIVIQEPTCLHMSDSLSTTVAGIGSGTVYVNASSEAIVICCPVEGERLSSTWKKNGLPLTNGSGYEVHNDYLRIDSSLFDDSCATYTCEVTFVGVTATVQESTVVCTGGMLYNVLFPSNCTVHLVKIFIWYIIYNFQSRSIANV